MCALCSEEDVAADLSHALVSVPLDICLGLRRSLSLLR